MFLIFGKLKGKGCKQRLWFSLLEFECYFLPYKRDAGIRYRRLSQVRLEELRAKLQNAARTINDLTAKCLLDVEAQVANALCNEIRRLGELVDSFSGHSFVADDEAALRTYRHELNAYIERELGKKLADACAGDIHSQVVRAEQIMASKYWFDLSIKSCLTGLCD